MKRKQAEVFVKNLNDFKKSLYWLEKVQEKVRDINIKNFQNLNEEDLEKIEVLFSRFYSYETLIAMKDLRNELAHEYVGERLISKLDEVKEFSEKLIEIGNRVIEYGERELLPKLRR